MSNWVLSTDNFPAVSLISTLSCGILLNLPSKVISLSNTHTSGPTPRVKNELIPRSH